MIEPYMIKMFLIFVVIIFILAYCCIGKCIMIGYKKGTIKKQKLPVYLGIMILISFLLLAIIVYALSKI